MTKFKVKVNATSTCKNVEEYDIEVSSSRQSIEFNEKTLEYFSNVLINEYNIERNKKSSFENRAVGLIAFIPTCFSLFVSKVEIGGWKTSLQEYLTYYLVIKITASFLAIYFCICAIYSLFHIVNVKTLDNTDIEKLFKKENMQTSPLESLQRLNNMYHVLIKKHRDINKQNADYLKSAIHSTLYMIAGLIVYIVM